MDTPGLARALLPQGPFLWPFLFGAGIYGIRYLLLAGIAFLAWYGKRAVQPRNRKLQDAAPRAGQIRREIAYSVMAVLIFGVINGVIFGYGLAPHTQLYWNVAQHGWVYFWLSIPLMILVHDLSTNPTPWTAYAFHPFESVVEALGVVLILFIMPSHPSALLIFQTISTVINVYGHLGFELYPRGWPQHPLGRWINTSVAHNTHHDKARHNYGFYFLFWDRWMGTLDPSYEARYRAKFAV